MQEASCRINASRVWAAELAQPEPLAQAQAEEEQQRQAGDGLKACEGFQHSRQFPHEVPAEIDPPEPEQRKQVGKAECHGRPHRALNHAVGRWHAAAGEIPPEGGKSQGPDPQEPQRRPQDGVTVLGEQAEQQIGQPLPDGNTCTY